MAKTLRPRRAWLIKRKAGPPLLVRDVANKKGVIRRTDIMFVLKRSVTITGRHYVERTQMRIMDDLADIVGDKVETMVKGAVDGDS